MVQLALTPHGDGVFLVVVVRARLVDHGQLLVVGGRVVLASLLARLPQLEFAAFERAQSVGPHQARPVHEAAVDVAAHFINLT